MNLESTVQGLKELETIVPNIHEKAIPILVAHYIRKGRIRIDEATRITGLSEQHIGKMAGIKTEKGWAEKARHIIRLRGDQKKGMKEWVRTNLNMNPEYVLRILKARREFGGSQVEKLPASKVFMLFRLNKETKDLLKTTGILKKMDESYTVDDLRKMKGSDYRRLIRAVIQ